MSSQMFQTNRQLTESTIRGMPFKAKLTTLFNTRGLTGFALLEYHQNNCRNSGSHN